MKILAAVGLVLSAATLSGCGNSLDKVLAGGQPEGGYLVTRQNISNYYLDGVSQIGALYYVRQGQPLSIKKPQSVKNLCAVIKAYDTPTPAEQTFDPPPVETRQYAPTVKLPALLPTLLTGATVEAGFDYTATYNIKNIKYKYLEEEDLSAIETKLRSGTKCKNRIANINKKAPKSAATIFQLVGIATADIDVSISSTATASGGPTGITVGGKYVKTYKTVTTDSVFKVYREVY